MAPSATALPGVDYPRTAAVLRAWFSEDDACLSYLARLRWPTGFRCPSCDSARSWRTAQARWMCADCGRQTSVTAGTVFHQLRSPLPTWFAALWQVTARPSGASALELRRTLGLASQESVWAWLDKLRGAMVRPDLDRLTGVVELDEIPAQVLAAAGDTDHPATILLAVERPHGHDPARIRLRYADRGAQLVGFAMDVIEEGAAIVTEQATTLRRLAGLGYRPYRPIGSPRISTDRLGGVQEVVGALRPWLAAAGPTTPSQLAYYLDEFSFRFNHRAVTGRGLLFHHLLVRAVTASPPGLADETG